MYMKPAACGVPGSHLLRRAGELDGPLGRFGQRLQGRDELVLLGLGAPAELAGDVGGEHDEGHDLGHERLGRGDRHFRAGLQEHRGVRLAGDRRADGIGDGDDRGSAVVGQAGGGDRVGGFARLRHGDDERSRIQRRRAVAELGGDVGAGRNAQPLLEELSPDQRRVVGGAAGDQLDAGDVDEPLADRVDLLQADRVAAHPTGHGRAQRGGCSWISLSMKWA
jgi:hypothetical protein